MGFDITGIETAVEGVLGKIDLPLLISAAQSLVAAWPTIEPQIAEAVTEVPAYIADIKKALSGETPTDADWAALDAQLDANDANIAASGAAAQAELDRRNSGGD